MKTTRVFKSEEETLDFARNFAKTLKPGQIVALSGELGAGKTVFVKGLAKGLGVNGVVRSPSFLIMRVYKVKKNLIKNFCHIDAYRIANEKELEAIGVKDYLNDKNTLCAIEWPENAGKLFLKNIIFVKMKILDEDKREVEIIL